MNYPTLLSLLETPQIMDTSAYVETIHRICESLNQHCRPWLEEIDYNLNVAAWRGSSKTIPKYEMSTLRTDRISHMDQEDQLSWNISIKKAGKIANRTNSFFVVGSREAASHFGKPYVFIPLGRFHYTWSPVAADAAQWMSSAPDDELAALRAHTLTLPFKGDDGSIKQALSATREVMVYSDSKSGFMFNPDIYDDIARIYHEEFS